MEFVVVLLVAFTALGLAWLINRYVSPQQLQPVLEITDTLPQSHRRKTIMTTARARTADQSGFDQVAPTEQLGQLTPQPRVSIHKLTINFDTPDDPFGVTSKMEITGSAHIVARSAHAVIDAFWAEAQPLER